MFLLSIGTLQDESGGLHDQSARVHHHRITLHHRTLFRASNTRGGRGLRCDDARARRARDVAHSDDDMIEKTR